MDQNAPIESKHVFPKRSAKTIDRREKPTFLRSLQNSQRDTMNLGITTPYSVSQQTVSLLHVFD